MSKNNLRLINVKGNVRNYSDGDINIIYYTNTSIPEHTDMIKNIIEKNDYIIVSGHDPHSEPLDYIKRKLHFIGCENTCFYQENTPDNPNSIINRLHLKEIQHKFCSYTFLQNNGNMTKFHTWEEFFQESCKF